jgi:hypothetical protein
MPYLQTAVVNGPLAHEFCPHLNLGSDIRICQGYPASDETTEWPIKVQRAHLGYLALVLIPRSTQTYTSLAVRGLTLPELGATLSTLILHISHDHAPA